VETKPRLGVTGNSFLDALPAQSLDALRPALIKMRLERALVLGKPGVRIDHIYFPVHSVISTVATMAGGESVEVGLAGHEGMSALSIVFGSRITPHYTIVQVPDSAHCLEVDTFLERMASDADLRPRVLAYAEYTFIAAAQFAACNRLHPIEERYARWLLMADDRVGRETFDLTQEFSAQMLGVRRAGVTEVAGTLSKAGLISYQRGHVRVLDRDGLKKAACECYHVVNGELLRLMGYGPRKARS
jgi:CRP-like cAMP-binding protein